MFAWLERIGTATGKEIVSNNTPQSAFAQFTEAFGKENVSADTGVWLPCLELGESVELKIARIGNPEFEKMTDALNAPYERKRKVMPRKVMREALPRIYASVIWRDTRGLPDGVTPPNLAEREEILRKSPKFLDYVHDLADDLNDGVTEAKEAALGNSSTSSAGA